MNKGIVAEIAEAPACVVIGAIVKNQGLNGGISQETTISGDLASAYTTNAAPYTGEYEVTPKIDGQQLETKHKYMTDDVTIHAIPFFEVGNTSGGNTVFIADEIEKE